MTDVTRGLSYLLLAYVIVGVLELIFGQSLRTAGKNWDKLAGWKKFLISIFVIACALGAAVMLIPIVANV